MRPYSGFFIVLISVLLGSVLAALAQGSLKEIPQRHNMEEGTLPLLLSGPGSDTTCVYFEDFQDGPSGWVPVDLLAPEEQPLYWHQTTYDHGDGQGERTVMWCGDSLYWWATPPGYGNLWVQHLTKDFDLSSAVLQGPQVAYELQYDTEAGWDFVYLDVSTDGGEIFSTEKTWDDASDFFADTTDLSAYSGEIVTLRFRFESDGTCSDEDGNYDSNGAVRIDWIEVTGYPRDNFDSGNDGWVPSTESGSEHTLEYRLAELPGCDAEQPCECYCWSWVAWEESTGDFPFEKDFTPIDIGIESPVIPIPDDGSEYILKFDAYANLPLHNLVFYRWEVATPPAWNWENDTYVTYSQAGFVTSTKNITAFMTPGADSIKIRLSGVDMYDEWSGSYPWTGEHTAAPMFDNVGIYVRNTNASGVPDVPTPCTGDADGDGIFGTDDLCVGEDASFFDSNGDGCIDVGAGGRHTEYWDRGAFPITYYIHEDGAPGIGDGSDTTAIIGAFNAWCLPVVDAGVTYGGLTAQADADAFDQTNLVTFQDGEYQFGSGVVAVGLTTSFIEPSWFANKWWRPGEIMDSDVIFNPDMEFRTASDGPEEGLYIECVAAHETGHVFGIHHSPVRSATMYFILPPGLDAASLESDDLMAITKAYGIEDSMAAASVLKGTVTDGYTSDPVPGAAVFAIDASGGDTTATEFTLPDGTYSFMKLPDGDYYVSVHPLEGSSAIGFLRPGYVNALIETTAVTNFVPESWDSLESAYDDATDRDPLAVMEDSETIADIVTNIDDTAPEVTAVVPDSGATDISIDTSILVAFSERMNTGTLQGNFNLTNTGSQEFVFGNATMLRDDSVLAFIPLSELAFSTTYELMLEPGIEDLFGNGLSDTFVIYFTTEEEPDVALSSLSPSKGVIGMTISLNGKGFDPEPANNTVSFNGVTAVVSEASPAQLVVTVPETATSGAVNVYNHTQDLVSNDLQFTVLSSDEVPRGFNSGICALSATPYDLTVVSTGNHVFVATDAGAEVVDTDPASPGYMTATTIAISGGLSHIDAGPAGNRVYGVSNTTNRLCRMSSTPGSMMLLSEKAIDAVPRGILIHPRGHRAYIPTDEGEIQVWDIQESSPTFETQIGHLAPVDPNVRGELATYPAGDIMLAITGTGNMFAADLDSNEITDTVKVGVYPKDISIDPLGNLAYSCDEMGFVSVISLTQMESVWKVRTGGTPDGITLTPAGSFAIVVNRELDLLSAIDLRETSPTYLSVVATIDLPVNPTDVELSPDGDYAFAISEAAKQLVSTSLGVGPSLVTLSRKAGPEGTRLVLAGSGFSIDSSATVSFDGLTATPSRLTDSSLTVVVPAGATDGEVSVITEVDGGVELESNRVYFEVLSPTEGDLLRLAGAFRGTPLALGDVGPVLQVSPDGDFLCLADPDGRLHMLVAAEGSEQYHHFAGSFDLGSVAADVVISQDCDRAFVVLPDSGFVHVIGSDRLRSDFLTLVGAVDFRSLGDSVIARAAVSLDGSVLLVSDTSNAQVHFVDILPGSPSQYEITASVSLANPPVNGHVEEMAFHPGGQYVYLPVRDPDPAVVLVLDVDPLSPTYQTVVYALALPGPYPQEIPTSISFTPDGDRCLVLTQQESGTHNRTVVMLDSSDPAAPVVSKSLALGGTSGIVPEHIDVSPRGDRAVAGVREEGLFNLEIRTGPDSLILIEQVGDPSHHLAQTGNDYSYDASRFYCVSTSSDTLCIYDFSDADSLAVHSGSGQSGIVNEILAKLLCVEVSGSGGTVPGVPVAFSVTSGGGTFAGNDSTEQVVPTDADGIASVEWTLGPVVGMQGVEAAATGLRGSPCAFTAEGLADPETLPLTVTRVSPDSGASDVSLVTSAQVTFSRAVDSTTVRDTTFYLHDGDFFPIDAAIGFADDNRRVSISPLRSLQADSTYWIEMTTDILDVEGGPLDRAASSSFGTEPYPPIELAAIQPPSAPEGSAIMLSGRGFSEDYWNNKVWFDDLEAYITAGGVDFLSAIVPIDASSCSVKVLRYSPTPPATSNGVPFTVIPGNEAPMNNVTGSISTSSATRSVAITPDGACAYAVSPDADLVSVIDFKNLIHLTSIAVGENPVAITIDPTGTFAYVANFIDGTVSVIDTDTGSPDHNKVVDAFSVGIGPADIAMTPDGDRLVVANFAANGVSIVDTDSTSQNYRSVVASIATGSGTRTVAITPDGGRIYVGNDLGYLVISGLSYGVVSSIATGSGTRTLAITPDGGLLVLLTTEGVINLYDINEESLDYNQVVASVMTGSGTSTFAISPDGGFLYMIQEVGDVILVGMISLTNFDGVLEDGSEAPHLAVQVTMVDTVVAGEDPACIAFDPSGSGAFVVTNAGDKTVTVHGDPTSGTEHPKLSQTLRSFPNPFRESAEIRFAVPEALHVDVAVYDVRGRLVRTIVSRKVLPGIHAVSWDGRDNSGNRASSGVYFCRFRAGDNVRTRKMVMLR